MRIFAGVLTLWLGLCSCYAPRLDACRVRCAAPGGGCPDGTICGTDAYCHAEGHEGDTCTSVGVSVAVTPETATALPETTLPLAATVTGTADTTVTWEVVEAAGGSVSADGVYLAPAAEGTYHVLATSHADASKIATAAVTVKAPGPAGVLASAGSIATATGHSVQPHLVYAAGTHEWWLFYDDSAAPTQLRTRHSTDFTAWAVGSEPSLNHTHAGDGRALSVAYRQLGGHDVVHVTQGYNDGQRGRLHWKATLAAGSIAFGTPVFVNGGNGSDPDGAATVIDADGLVIDASGWLSTPATPPLDPCGTGDVVMYESQANDDGVRSFDGVGWNQRVLWCVQNQVNARQLIADGNTIYQLFEDGNDDAAPVNLLMTVRQPGGSWLPLEPPGGPRVTPPAVFADQPSVAFDVNDWMALELGGQLHAVRRRRGTGDSYQHRVYDLGAGGWSDGDAIPPLAGPPGSGLFLARYGGGMILVAVDAAAGNAIRYSFWDQSTWSAWRPLVTTPASRNYIGGADPEGGVRPAVIWTQTNGASYDIAGLWLP